MIFLKKYVGLSQGFLLAVDGENVSSQLGIENKKLLIRGDMLGEGASAEVFRGALVLGGDPVNFSIKKIKYADLSDEELVELNNEAEVSKLFFSDWLPKAKGKGNWGLYIRPSA